MVNGSRYPHVGWNTDFTGKGRDGKMNWRAVLSRKRAGLLKSRSLPLQGESLPGDRSVQRELMSNVGGQTKPPKRTLHGKQPACGNEDGKRRQSEDTYVCQGLKAKPGLPG